MESLKIAIIIGIIILTSAVSTKCTKDSFFNAPSDTFLRSKRNTENTTPNDLITDVSSSNTTVTGIISSITSAGDICSLLDLSVGKLPLNSKLTVFRNFSYDGSTFCLKWTIVGDLKDVKKCVIKYIFKRGKKSILVECPLVNNEIKTWTSEDEIFRICLDIYAPNKMSFCNSPDGKTTAAVSKTTILTETTSVLQDSTTSIVTETSPFKATETVRLTEDSTDNHPDYFTVSISVYSNSSVTTSDILLTTETSTSSRTRSTKDTAATSIPPRELATVAPQMVSSEEGYSDENTINEEIDSTGFTMTTELVTLNTTSIIHTITSNISSASTSTATVIESITPTDNILFNTISNLIFSKHIYIPFICLLILVIFAIITFKIMKKQESKRNGVKLRSQSTRDQSVNLSDLDRDRILMYKFLP